MSWSKATEAESMSQAPIILDYIFDVSKVYPLVNAHVFKTCFLLNLQAQTVCCTLGWLFLYFHHQKLGMVPEEPLHAVLFCVTLLLRHWSIIEGWSLLCRTLSKPNILWHHKNTGTLSDHAVILLGHQVLHKHVESIPACVHAVTEAKGRYIESTDTLVIFTSFQVQFI